MKLTRKISVGLAVGALCVGANSRAQIIDDFSSNDLANYNQTIVLAQSADPGALFGIATSPAGTLQVSQVAWTAGAQQQVFLRNDGASLAVGQVLRIDLAFPSQNTLYSDFGLALMASATPTAANWTSGTSDVRFDLLNLYIKGQFATIGYRGSDSANVQKYSSAGVAPVGGLSAVTGLWISRPSSTEFDVGYAAAGGDTLLIAMTGMDAAIGNALGFYSDVRQNTTYGYFDNLRLEPIPEPATVALCGLGLAGLLAMKRRKS